MNRFKRQSRQWQLGILAGLAALGWAAWLTGSGWLAALGLGLGIGGVLALFSRAVPFRVWLQATGVQTKNGQSGLSLLKEMVTMGLLVLQLLIAVRFRTEIDLSGGQLGLAIGLMVFSPPKSANP